MELETRTCDCGSQFRVLTTSKQLTCSSQCSGGKLANRCWRNQLNDKVAAQERAKVKKAKKTKVVKV